MRLAKEVRSKKSTGGCAFLSVTFVGSVKREASRKPTIWGRFDTYTIAQGHGKGLKLRNWDWLVFPAADMDKAKPVAQISRGSDLFSMPNLDEPLTLFLFRADGLVYPTLHQESTGSFPLLNCLMLVWGMSQGLCVAHIGATVTAEAMRQFGLPAEANNHQRKWAHQDSQRIKEPAET